MNVARSLAAAAVVATLFVVPLVHAADPTPLEMATLALKHAAYDTPESIVKARAQLAGLEAADPKSSALHYWVALADYRLAPRLMSKDKKEAGRYINDGIDHLDQAVKLNPKFADAIALRAGLQGLSVAIDPSRGMMLGAEMEESFGRAAGMEPSNPRVVLLQGINTLNKPKFVGGGADKALVTFLKAAELFAAEKPGAINWGHDDAYAWAGRAAVKLAKTADARTFYKKALEINPGNQWVEHVLLPALDKEKEKS
jgi:tetratricopeptide (TPR) repeat protein